MSHPYASCEYAEILDGGRGNIVPVPEWGLYGLRRQIEGPDAGSDSDVMGCYPLAVFGDNVDLKAGLEKLRSEGFVSVVLVADPILRPKDNELDQAFGIYRKFKVHYICDRSQGLPKFSKHHRYELRRAKADVRQIDLVNYLPDWWALYQELIGRRRITGVAAFSQVAFDRLAKKMAGLVSFGAFVGESLVACHLWVRSGHHVHSHLAASNEAGRRAGAPYLLYDAAIRYFDDVVTIDLGGGAGLKDDPNDGLARFKRGFSNSEKSAYLCGAILDPDRYQVLCEFYKAQNNEYFPAYRTPKAK